MTGRENTVSKTSNIFRPSEVDTFAVPTAVFNRLLADHDMKISAVILYAYILSKAESPTVRIYTGDALNDTGLSRPVFAEARETLVTSKLIMAEETSKQGVWQYEIRSEKGGKLATYEDFVVFRDLPCKYIEAFYANRLGVKKAPGKQSDDRLLFHCPFHTSAASKPTLTVTVDNGQYHGRYICGKKHCGKRGGLIEFEQAMSEKSGEHLTKTQASHSVRSFMVDRLRPDEAEHPAIKEMREMNEASKVTI